MAQRTQIDLIDDLNGEEAEETIRFGVDGADYEIDLTAENAETLRTLLTKYAHKGRKTNANRRKAGSKNTAATSTSRSEREETRKIRQWAQDNAYSLSTRGRVPQAIVDAYNAR